jgi:hypothetical protein
MMEDWARPLAANADADAVSFIGNTSTLADRTRNIPLAADGRCASCCAQTHSVSSDAAIRWGTSSHLEIEPDPDCIGRLFRDLCFL